VHGRPEWTDGKNERSRRTIPIDATTANLLVAHRRLQLEERLAPGHAWHDHDLVVATRTGTRVSPGNFDQILDLLSKHTFRPRRPNSAAARPMQRREVVFDDSLATQVASERDGFGQP